MKTLTTTSILIFFLFCCQLNAAAGTNELEWTFESYFHGVQSEISSSTANPGNLIFESPFRIFTLDNRLELKWLINDAKVIARPRWILDQTETKNTLTNINKTTSKGKIDLTDAFWEQTWKRKFSTTIGLQVYQWGPSEVFNSSNPFFRFQTDQQTFSFKEKGRALIRANYTINARQNLVLIVEPVSNNERYWMAEKEFKPQAAIKYEFNQKNSRNYFGIIGGSEHQNNPFLGEYFQYEFKTGFSTFLDAKHSLGYQYYFPKINSLAQFDMVSNETETKEWSHLVTGGFRYEGAFDFRIEGVHNSAGYDRETYKNAISSITNFFSQNYIQNITRFSSTGLNLISKNYAYASLRITNPFATDANFYLRNFTSLTDNSGLGQFEFDFNWGDFTTWFASYTQFYGAENTEFTMTDKWRAQIGGKITL